MINPNRIFEITGVHKTPIHSVGEHKIKFEINDEVRFCKFQVLHDISGIPYDGLIGNNFFKNQCTLLDFENKILHLKNSRK